jgi:hypothetical protein
VDDALLGWRAIQNRLIDGTDIVSLLLSARLSAEDRHKLTARLVHVQDDVPAACDAVLGARIELGGWFWSGRRRPVDGCGQNPRFAGLMLKVQREAPTFRA